MRDTKKEQIILQIKRIYIIFGGIITTQSLKPFRSEPSQTDNRSSHNERNTYKPCEQPSAKS